MKKIYILYLALFSISSLAAQIDRSVQPTPGPAPVIQLDEPQTFTLKNGMTVMVVENHKLPRAAVTLNIDNPPIFEGDYAGANSLLGSMLGKGSLSISKNNFEEEIDFMGASLSFGSSSAFASSLSRYFPRVLELLADAALNPNFLQEEFEKEKEKLPRPAVVVARAAQHRRRRHPRRIRPRSLLGWQCSIPFHKRISLM